MNEIYQIYDKAFKRILTLSEKKIAKLRTKENLEELQNLS